jgi:hypothetical protein
MSEDNIVSLIKNKTVIVTILGGLGNQMFEVASGYALSKINNIDFCVGHITSRRNINNKHNINNNNYSITIFKYFFSRYPRVIDDIYYKILKKCGYLYKSSSNTFNNVEFPLNISNNGIILFGRFQNYNLFSDYENEIRNLFIRGLQNNIRLMSEKYNTAFLHIRRGDYLLIQNLYKQPNIQYYKKCVEKLKESNTNLIKIFIFSNCIKYVKKKPFFNDPLFEIIEEPDELNTLALMSLCKAGAIITNSTFGWWGAFLGAYESRNPVFGFKRWILTQSTPHLFPKEWNRI